MPTRRRQHYIPVFYLKQWADASGKLVEFSRPYKTPEGSSELDIKCIPVKPRRTSPDGTGYIKNLYTFPALNPELADFLENEFFLQVDNAAAGVLRRLRQGDIDFDIESKSAWARFLTSMFHRSPEGVQRIIRRTREYLPSDAEEFRPQYDILRANRDDLPRFDDFIKSLTDSDYQEFNLRILRTVMDSQRVGAALCNMIWTVVPNVGRYPLFTSDRPITMTALGRPDAHLVMPLSPCHIFLAATNEVTMENLDNRNRYGGLAEIVNNRVVRQARKYVYAVDDTRKDFLTHRLGDRQQWSPLE